jgi:peptidoglycan/xylan/chitin deacetylase (PgdA/CDA1 family)
VKGIEAFKLRIHRFLKRELGVILTYHSVVSLPLGFDIWTHIPLELFEEHMAILNNEANVISLRDMVAGLQHQNLPKYAVAVTFDDGFGNNYSRAYPVLQRYRIPATIFLATGFIGTQKLFWPERLAYQLIKTGEKEIVVWRRSLCLRDKHERRETYIFLCDYLKKLHPVVLEAELALIEKELMVQYSLEDSLFREWLPLNWEQVKEMVTSGLVDFGGHTVDHHILSRLEDAESQEQIKSCRQMLDAHLGCSRPLWAFPNGTPNDYSAKHKQMIASQGFSAMVTTDLSYVSGDSDLITLGRWGIGCNDGAHRVKNILAKRNLWDGLTVRKKCLKAIACGIFRHNGKN